MKTNITILLAIMLIFSNCSNNSEKKAPTTKEVPQKTDSVIVNKGPIINIEDTIAIKQSFIICLKDSSKTIEGMMAKLKDIYNTKIADIIKSNKLTISGSPMAWQSIQKNAYFFEAGIPVSNVPKKLGKGMYLKSTQADSAVIAHFWGPLEQTKAAYDAIAESLIDKHKTKTNSYELYKSNQFAIDSIDPYKQQTDIVITYNGIKNSK